MDPASGELVVLLFLRLLQDQALLWGRVRRMPQYVCDRVYSAKNCPEIIKERGNQSLILMSDYLLFLLKKQAKERQEVFPYIYPFSSEWDEVPRQWTVKESGITDALIHLAFPIYFVSIPHRESWCKQSDCWVNKPVNRRQQEKRSRLFQPLSPNPSGPSTFLLGSLLSFMLIFCPSPRLNFLLQSPL